MYIKLPETLKSSTKIRY